MANIAKQVSFFCNVVSFLMYCEQYINEQWTKTFLGERKTGGAICVPESWNLEAWNAESVVGTKVLLTWLCTRGTAAGLSPYAPTSNHICFPLWKATYVRALALWQKDIRHNSQCFCTSLVHLILWNYLNLILHSNCYQQQLFILFDVLLHAKILVFSLSKELWNFLEFQVVPFQSSTVQAVERTNPYFLDNPSTYADSWLTQFLGFSKLFWFVRKAFVVLCV